MDNITHSLIGAALGQAGLKRKTGLAMPALILAANLPDVDAPCAVYGVESLTMRRGLSHGPIALALLPLLLAGLLWAFDRWQAGRGKRPEGRLPVRFGWLLALCYIGTLSHPLFDWFNNYGIRLLEPFSSRWFYGDVLFIIDLWILIGLGSGIWLSLRRERVGAAKWTRPARIALIGLIGYVGMNLAISRIAADSLRMEAPYPPVVVANEVPVAFWRRDLLWRDGERYGSVHWSLFSGRGPVGTGQPHNMADPRVAAWAKGDPKAQAFLFWTRMPIARIGPNAIVLTDQRFDQSPASSAFTVTLRPSPSVIP